MQTFLPTVAERDETGRHAAEVIGDGINGQGETATDALTDAAASLQDVIWPAVGDGEPVPAPLRPTSGEAERGRVALIQATPPAPEPVPA